MDLNASKTKSLLLASHQKLRSLGRQSPLVTIDDTVVEQVHLAKILGVLFDDQLSWEQHIDDLCKRLNSRLSLLRRINPYPTLEGSFHFYNSSIHNHLLYCSSALVNSSLTSILRLLRVQKRAARVILNADLSTPSITLFSKLKCMDPNNWRINYCS